MERYARYKDARMRKEEIDGYKRTDRYSKCIYRCCRDIVGSRSPMPTCVIDVDVGIYLGIIHIHARLFL
jgi:hypothetical protein